MRFAILTLALMSGTALARLVTPADTQGIAAFTALQRRGIPSRLLVFPDENHWVQKPRNSLQWHAEVLGWLAKWLRPETGRQ